MLEYLKGSMKQIIYHVEVLFVLKCIYLLIECWSLYSAVLLILVIIFSNSLLLSLQHRACVLCRLRASYLATLCSCYSDSCCCIILCHFRLIISTSFLAQVWELLMQLLLQLSTRPII